MSNVETGGPAFPHDRDAQHYERSGMTMRDYFAAKAMPAMAWMPKSMDACAGECYRVADAMLKARDEPCSQPSQAKLLAQRNEGLAIAKALLDQALQNNHFVYPVGMVQRLSAFVESAKESQT